MSTNILSLYVTSKKLGLITKTYNDITYVQLLGRRIVVVDETIPLLYTPILYFSQRNQQLNLLSGYGDRNKYRT